MVGGYIKYEAETICSLQSLKYCKWPFKKLQLLLKIIQIPIKCLIKSRSLNSATLSERKYVHGSRIVFLPR